MQGHTDDRGSSEYNLALGQRRAEAVVKSLELLGAQPAQLEAVSFGKERPAVQGETEEAWAKNRRAELASEVTESSPRMRQCGSAAQLRAAGRRARGAAAACALGLARSRSRRRRTPACSTTTRPAAPSSTCASSSSRATSRRARRQADQMSAMSAQLDQLKRSLLELNSQHRAAAARRQRQAARPDRAAHARRRRAAAQADRHRPGRRRPAAQGRAAEGDDRRPRVHRRPRREACQYDDALTEFPQR